MTHEFFSEWSVRIWPPSALAIAILLLVACAIIGGVVVASVRWGGKRLR
jgi:hypothetical protein